MTSVTIRYCRLCNWMLRSSWMAQELLTTFADEIGEVRLQVATGGVFEIDIDHNGVHQRIWSRADDGGFPDIKLLKQKVRDVMAPERSLGHSEEKK